MKPLLPQDKKRVEKMGIKDELNSFFLKRKESRKKKEKTN